MDVQRLIIEHGAWFYPFTFALTFIEGETFVLVAGFAAAQGLLNAPLLLLAAWLGSFAGDQCYFWIGRNFGLRLLSRRPIWRARVDSALGWIKRYDTWFILSFRFIYGVRNFSSFALGRPGAGGGGAGAGGDCWAPAGAGGRAAHPLQNRADGGERDRPRADLSALPPPPLQGGGRLSAADDRALSPHRRAAAQGQPRHLYDAARQPDLFAGERGARRGAVPRSNGFPGDRRYARRQEIPPLHRQAGGRARRRASPLPRLIRTEDQAGVAGAGEALRQWRWKAGGARRGGDGFNRRINVRSPSRHGRAQSA